MGLKKNFIYNSILTLSQYMIGLITFPYISRVLGVSNIGIVSFTESCVNYFILFSTMGIGIMGAREIAKYRNDKDKLSSVFSSLLSLSIILTLVVLIIYYIALLCIPELNQYKELFYIGSAKLVFSAFLIEWFYRGIEDFKYITTINIAIKLVYCLLLFIFVQNKEDYVVYFLLTVGMVVINAIINTVYSKNYTKLCFRDVRIKPYIKQSIYLGSYMVLTSMYTTFNIMYLGFVSNTSQVGYYWAALKIYGIVLGFFTAFTTVMLPRMSALLSIGNEESFKELISISFKLLFIICFPLIICTTILAPQIITILSGSGYEGAIIPMQIIMPLILFVGFSQILAIQVLMPLQKDKLILIGSIIGATVGIISNLILSSKMESIGSAIVLLISEITVTTYYAWIVFKKKIIEFPFKPFIQNLTWSIPYVFICYGSSQLFKSALLILLFAGLLSIIYFILLDQYFVKGKIINRIIATTKH